MELPEISCLLERASEQLQIGELLHDDSFSMFEAMSAVEIGDPKLDAGVPAQSGPRVLPDIPAAGELSSADVIAIADRLFAAEATWHQGSPLAQTVFTCLYLLEPHSISHAEGNVPLRALCRIVHATSILVRDLILAGNVCEDEDFVIHTFGVQSAMSQRGADVSALEDIALAIDMLSDPNIGKDAGKAGATGRIDPADVAALLCRLRFRESLLKALQRAQRSTKQDLQLARKQLHLAKTQLAEVRRTAHASPQSVPGFCPDINCSLMAPVPSKPVQLLSSVETWERLEKLLDELLLVCEVSKVASYAELKAFLYDFASRGCGAISRSALHMSLLGRANPPGDLVGPWLPRRPMLQAALRLPLGVALGPETDLFVEQACLAVAGWCQDMCLNRARQRRRHRRSIEDWFHLCEHALTADASPDFQQWLQSTSSAWHWPHNEDDPQGPLGCWVERECAAMLLQHLVLGFELELYAPEEFCMMYWYCDYLYGVVQAGGSRLLQHAADSSNSVDSSFKPAVPGARSPASGKHRKAERQKKHVPPTGTADTGILKAQVRHAHLHRQLCQAFMRLAAGLTKAGYLGGLPSLFNTEEERFHQRFASFSVLFRPEPLSYSHYSKSIDMRGKHAADILAMSLDGFMESRRILTSLAYAAGERASKIGAGGMGMQTEEYQALERLAAQNAVGIKVLLNTLLREEQAHQGPAPSSLTDGHAEDDRPKPCVPQSEQIRQDSSAAAKRSMPEEQAAGESSGKGGGKQTAKTLKIEWDFSQHVKYPVMRMRQVGKP